MLDLHPLEVGEESGYIAPDPRRPNYIYGGTVTVEQIDTGRQQNVDPTLAHPDVVWRDAWTLPLVFSAADRRTVYFGRQNVFRSRNGGQTWQIVSPDLTRPHTPALPNLDASTRADDNGLQRHGVVYAIAPSPLDARLVWVGTDDGLVWLTRDDAAHWLNVTPPGVGAWSNISIIDASHFDRKTAYVAVDRHRLDDYAPYIYRTHDWGRTWTPIATGIPYGDFVNVVREDPVNRGLLFAGTEKGVEISFDDGNHWQSLQLNLPVSSVRDLVIPATTSSSARTAAESGSSTTSRRRARWRKRKHRAPMHISSRRRRRTAFADATLTIAPLSRTSRWPTTHRLDSASTTSCAARTRPSRLQFSRGWARSASLVSAQPIHAVDPTTVDYVTSWVPTPQIPSNEPGAHRFVWGLHVGSDDGPLAPPGRYTVRIAYAGDVRSQTATVLRDPRIDETDAALREQYKLERRIEARRYEILAGMARAKRLLADPTLPAREASIVRQDILGTEPPQNLSPESHPSHDFTRLRAILAALENLNAAVETGDSAPTPDMLEAFHKISAAFGHTLARLTSIERTH